MYIKNDWVEYSQGEITYPYNEYEYNFFESEETKKLVDDKKNVKIIGKKVNQVHVFKKLKDFLENPIYWIEQENIVQNYAETTSDYLENKFIDLVDKQYAEVTYSNLFQYIFSTYPDLLKKFAKKVLDIEISKNTKRLEIIREEAHIDLLIIDDNSVIVIENKIKSDINGKKYDEYKKEISNQLIDYCNYVNLKSMPNDNYKRTALEKRFASKDLHFFIFAPNYNQIALKPEISVKGKDCNATYKIKTYKDIFEFFNQKQIKSVYENKLYYKEFLYSLGKHINSTDNAMELEMFRRFSKITKQAKKAGV